MHYALCNMHCEKRCQLEVNVRYVILADLGTAMFYNTPILLFSNILEVT